MASTNIAISLSELFCFHGADSDGDSEPYLWAIFFAVDGTTITQDPVNVGKLAGAPQYYFSPGSHGNLGSSISTGATLRIPAGVGTWKTTIAPIALTLPNLGDYQVPPVAGVVAVLMEENDTPNEDIEVGHQALNNYVQNTIDAFIAGIDLGAIAGQVEEILAGNSSLAGDPVATQAAAQAAVETIFSSQMAAIQGTLQATAQAVTFFAIFQSLGLGGEILSAISADEYQGQLFHLWTQNQFAATTSVKTLGDGPIAFVDRLEQQEVSPAWAYNVHGQAWQTVAPVPVAEGVPPGRWQVTGVNKAINEFGTRFVNQIGGPLADGTPWWLNRTTAVSLVQNGTNTFFVAAADGSVSEVRVSDALNVGHDYLTTTPDASTEDNLMSLPGAATYKIVPD